MLNPTIISGFLRTLGLVAPLVGQPGVTVLANAAATLLEAGTDGYKRFQALTLEMKTRADAGVTTTAQEILDDVERIKDLDARIQQA